MSVDLTQHERELLELLIGGASNKVAARQLGIALRTMELHRQKLMNKLGARSAAQLGYLYADLKRREGGQGTSSAAEPVSRAMAI